MAIQKDIAHPGSRQTLVYHKIFSLDWAVAQESVSVGVGSWKNAADRAANPGEPIGIKRFIFDGPNYPLGNINAGALAPIYIKLKELPSFAGGVDV